MTLIVEDGTGLTTAESYVSVADATAYLTAYKAAADLATWNAASTAEQERALRVATQYVDAAYGTRFPGSRLLDAMSLRWPRVNASDVEGYAIASTSVPTAVKNSTSEMALRVVLGDDLLAKLEDPGTVESTTVSVGPVSESITYQGGKPTRASYPLVDRILTSVIGSNAVLYPG